jgi:hypothetical protein
MAFIPTVKSVLMPNNKTRREKKLAANPELVSYRWKRDLVRHGYFSQIDSPMKAYLLGFIAADGHVLPSHHRITIELSAKDQDLLSLIRDELDGCEKFHPGMVCQASRQLCPRVYPWDI